MKSLQQQVRIRSNFVQSSGLEMTPYTNAITLVGAGKVGYLASQQSTAFLHANNMYTSTVAKRAGFKSIAKHYTNNLNVQGQKKPAPTVVGMVRSCRASSLFLGGHHA